MKLFKSKVATKNAIYKIVDPLTRGFFNDTAWENVNRVWKSLEADGVVVNMVNTRKPGTSPLKSMVLCSPATWWPRSVEPFKTPLADTT